MKILTILLFFIQINLVWSQNTIGKKCNDRLDCQDGIYCNGTEVCSPDDSGVKRCKVATQERCHLGVGLICIEDQKKCVKKVCQHNLDCNDGLFCTGNRECNPTLYGSSFNKETGFWGCTPKKNPCPEGMSCNEMNDSCSKPECLGAKADNDKDGHKSIACGGDDCDDNDSNRFPGNSEVCDSSGHDEDCDAETFGKRDDDSDGQVSAMCCQEQANGDLKCGKDCDDSNPLINFGTQQCIQHGQPQVFICGLGNSICAKGLTCYDQPNGSGVCAPK